MAKTYIDPAQIEMWDRSVCSGYQRERGSREQTTKKISERERRTAVRQLQITIQHLYDGNCAVVHAG